MTAVLVTVHLLAAGIWFGGSTALVFVGVPAIRILDGEPRGRAMKALGLPGDEDYSLAEALDDLADEAREALNNLDRNAREDDEAVRTMVSRRLKKACQRIWDRRPIVETVVLRV